MKEVTTYDRVLKARDKKRPQVTDYIKELFEDFIELKGDRLSKDDESILGGIAMFHGTPVTIIGQRKGKTIEENIRFNFGMVSPEGYRKGMRLMKQAEKFNRPVITFIDTPGAYPGKEAEEHGQANAIAESMAMMSSLKVPIIVIVTGEGNSGGALALGVGDKIWMLENSIYAVLSPEGFASILWKDSSLAPKASEVMKITAQELYEFGLIDDVIAEDKNMYKVIDKKLQKELKRLEKLSPAMLVENRYQKFRNIDEKKKPIKEHPSTRAIS